MVDAHTKILVDDLAFELYILFRSLNEKHRLSPSSNYSEIFDTAIAADSKTLSGTGGSHQVR